MAELYSPNLKKINLDRPDKYLGINWIFKFSSKLSHIGILLNNLEISSFRRI